MSMSILTRRVFLQTGAAGLAALTLTDRASGQEKKPGEKGKPTQFQVACMTLAYSQFPLERALSGLKSAGYKYVAWGTSFVLIGYFVGSSWHVVERWISSGSLVVGGLVLLLIVKSWFWRRLARRNPENV